MGVHMFALKQMEIVTTNLKDTIGDHQLDVEFIHQR